VKVLIVDDNTLIRKMIRATLEAEGESCVEAATAADALLALHREAPDVLLLDLNLPDADGFTLLRMLAASPAMAVPRIFLVTGSDDVGLGEEARRLGARGVLRKPVTPAVLLRTVREA
jgi:CheY-like chemotaxis protein